MLERTFSPIAIGPVTVPNRVARTGHVTMMAVGTGLNDRLIEYHTERARGGVGLSILEAISVHPSSGLSLAGWDDSVIEGYRKLMEAVEPHGMRVFQQLWHGGHVYPTPIGGPPWSPSGVPHPTANMPSLVMSAAQIEEVIDAFVIGAERCAKGGLHGVEAHAGHGYLLMQFLSPVLNRRDDQWGGSLDNRMRLLMTILRRIRDRVPGLAVGVRLSESGDAAVLPLDDVAEVAHRLEREGLVDYVNMSHSDYYHNARTIGGMEVATGYQLATTGRVLGGLKVPRLVTGRFRTLEEIEQVLRDGSADLVSMVRALIADPAIVEKTRRGHADQVRPCIACNQGCLGQAAMGYALGCTVNVAVSLEATLSERLIAPVEMPRRVLVVGGGPAGMEAARVAALRGHRVTLAEAAPDLGGALRIMKQAPGLATMGDIHQWLESEVFRLGVEVRTSQYMEAEDVIAFGADAVIIATGALEDGDAFQAMKPTHALEVAPGSRVFTPTDLLTQGDTLRGGSALVFDDIGHYEAIACADFLLERGVAVTFVTRQLQFAPTMERTLRGEAILEKLYAKGDFRVVPRAWLKRVRPGEAVIAPLQSAREETVPADVVVLVTFKRANKELYEALQGRVPALQRVGDALSPRDLQVAIREGHMAARGIE